MNSQIWCAVRIYFQPFSTRSPYTAVPFDSTRRFAIGICKPLWNLSLWTLRLLDLSTIWVIYEIHSFTLPLDSRAKHRPAHPNVVKMLDQLSPVAPARVRVVLLPIGQIKRSRFVGFVDRLQPEHVVRLGDISPDGRPNRSANSTESKTKTILVE